MHFTWNELHQRAEEMPQISKQEADGRQKDFGKHIPLGRRHRIGDGQAGYRCQDGSVQPALMNRVERAA